MTQLIDSHVHFWQLAREYYSWMTYDMGAIQRDFGCVYFESLKHTNNVSQIILVQAALTVEETRYILDLAGECDYVAAVVGKIDIEKGMIAIEQLDDFVTNPLFRGIRPMLKNMGEHHWLELPGMDEIIMRLMELDLTFECMVLPDEMDELLIWLNKYPGLRAVLSHGGMPDIDRGTMSIGQRRSLTWQRKLKYIASYQV